MYKKNLSQSTIIKNGLKQNNTWRITTMGTKIRKQRLDMLTDKSNVYGATKLSYGKSINL